MLRADLSLVALRLWGLLSLESRGGRVAWPRLSRLVEFMPESDLRAVRRAREELVKFGMLERLDGGDYRLCVLVNSPPPVANVFGEDDEPTRNQDPPDPLAGFDEFWARYPRKTAKEEARLAWMSRKVQGASNREAIMAGLEAQLLPDRTLDPKKERRFIPFPASWLRGLRWHDEIPPDQPAADRIDTILEGMDLFLTRGGEGDVG